MIKAKPEDFVVREIAGLSLLPSGPFRVYRLSKSGWTTGDLLKHLARSLGISPGVISYGGRKDKHGLTVQHIAIRDGRDFSRQGRNFSLESLGFSDRPMGPDLIRANAFRITIRGLAETETAARNLEETKISGIPNYFDDQRFRSYDPARGFFAEKVLRRHWNGALKVFMTSVPAGTRAPERERRTALFERWKDWPACLGLARHPFEKKIFGYLVEHPRELSRALHLISADEVSMQYAAFQSHLWNEVLRRLVKSRVPGAEAAAGAAGDYLFWRTLEGDASAFFAGLHIPAAAAKMDFQDAPVRAAYGCVFDMAGIGPADFRTKALRSVYFKSFPRKALVIPGNLRVLGEEPDILHPGRKSFTLSFELPRGSYATIVVKRLTLPFAA
ncbi:MAG: tRNA pseudouridine(13) synthase TruD [Candidatus Aminicenantes bacterium]|nr:tRNA pseudouridine(13) synthase TruD [Candidatus Aminicenantes bacterium]